MKHDIGTYLVWTAPAFILVFVAAFLIMGFLPPIPPSWDAEHVAAYYVSNRTSILIGATLIMQFSALLIFWIAGISTQIRRIEGSGSRILSQSQMLFGLCAIVLFIIMTLSWTIAAFRIDRSPEIVMVLNDIGWMAIVMPVLPLSLQAFVIGLAIVLDSRAAPLFPRWAAYMNFWVAVLFLPGAVAPFFKTGPFAWNGLLVFWVPLIVFAMWVIVMASLVTRAAAMPDRSSAQTD